MTKVEALEELYRALGGSDEIPEGSTIVDAIRKVAEAAQTGGGGGGGLVVTQGANGALDKTWKEIHDAMAAGVIPILKLPDDTDAQYGIADRVATIVSVRHETGSEWAGAYAVVDGLDETYTTMEETGYPEHEG